MKVIRLDICNKNNKKKYQDLITKSDKPFMKLLNAVILIRVVDNKNICISYL